MCRQSCRGRGCFIGTLQHQTCLFATYMLLAQTLLPESLSPHPLLSVPANGNVSVEQGGSSSAELEMPRRQHGGQRQAEG